MTVSLDGIDLVIFDKDGTLIEFDSMWSGWAVALADGLAVATGKPVDEPLFAMLGYDPASGEVLPGGGLAATPMSRLHDRTRDVLLGDRSQRGCRRQGARGRLARAGSGRVWPARWPICPPCSSRSTRAAGTSPWRRPTTASRRPARWPPSGSPTAIDAFVCADDGVAVKPAPDMVIHLCRAVGVPPTRTAVVGDSAADLRMARAAGAGLAIGVLTGVGGRADLEPLADDVIESVARLLDE